MGSRSPTRLGHGINVTKSAHILIEGNEVSGAGEPALAHGVPGHLARHHDRLDRARQQRPRQLRLRHLPRCGRDREPRSRTTRARATPAGTPEPRSASTSGAPRTPWSTPTSPSTTRTPGSTSGTARTAAIVTNNVSYRNGDHGIDNKGSNDTRILSNTVYLSTNSGIEVVNSTGVTSPTTSASTTASTARSPAMATSASTRSPRRPSPWTTTSCTWRLRA